MKDDKVRDPVHGFIHFDEIERKIIDSRPFQRLRNIKQLAFCYYVYPGAMHTRFEHSLGVMELATRVFDHFENSKYEEDSAEFRKNLEGLMGLEEARRLLRLTALLHDIGHLPYSHSGESILPEGKKHEDVSAAIIRESEIAEIIAKRLSPEMVDRVALLLSKEKAIPIELQILRQIISGQFDADRMDYLIRDSHHCGVAYGNFDYCRLLETLRLIPDDKGGLQLAIDRGGVHSLEALILARYFMFTQVYCHRTRRLYDRYLQEFLRSWGEIKVDLSSLTAVLNYDDNIIWGNIEKLKDSNEWAQRIYNRHNHHVLLYETNDHAQEKELSKIVQVIKEMEKDPACQGLNILCDEKARGSIHNFYTAKEAEKYEHEQDLKVIIEDGQKSLYEESEWLHQGPKEYWCIRAYGYGEKAQIEHAKQLFEQRMKS